MEADAAHAPNDQPKAKIFISYSRKDMSFADRLEAALKNRGFEPLIDRTEIYAFEDWWKRIEALIGRADTVVFALSPNSVKSDVALKEIAHAASLNKRFAPIVCRRVEDGVVPEVLRRLNFIFFTDPDHFDLSMEKLAEALETDIAWIRRHTEFGDAAHRWAEAGRPSGMLLRPPVLDQAEAWLAFRPGGAPRPTSETEAFIAESRKVILGTLRLRRIALGSIFALMMAVILGLVGWINQDSLKAQWHWYTVTRPYAAAQVWPYVLSAVREQALKSGASFMECSKDCPEMIVVPNGSFMMGGRNGIDAELELPKHQVSFLRPFAVSKYEITFEDWDACVTGGGCNGYRANDWWGRGQQPVVFVNWYDAQAYVAWLSAVTGKIYRLLSEAEYEYAARAGTETNYPWGDDFGKDNGNCNGCGSKWDNRQTAPVGSFAPNRFGLYDMVGNVWEWTEDCSHESYRGAPTDGSAWVEGGDCNVRMLRGGSWGLYPMTLHSSYRNGNNLGDRNITIGFRVARTLEYPLRNSQ